MFRTFCRALIPALVLLIVLPAIAGEGRTPIYAWQTTITQPGKYVVTRDIIPMICSAPVIDIQVPAIGVQPPGYVDIDLNGFRLYACPGHPVIQAGSQDNITIRNGTLGFGDYGILVVGDPGEGNRKVVVEDVKILDVIIAGIQLEGITDFALRRNNVTTSDFHFGFIGQGQTGIVVDQGGRPFQAKGTIEDNGIERTGAGIVVRGGSSVTIVNNRMSDLVLGSPGGITYSGSNDGLIAENTIRQVLDGDGIHLNEASGNKIHNNVVYGCERHGIFVSLNSDDNLVLDNVVTRSGFDGLVVDGSRNHIDRNVLNSNCGSGIQNCYGLHFPNSGGGDSTYGRNTARGNFGNPQLCAWPGAPALPPTTDFCDEQVPGPVGTGNSSFADNFMPTPF